MCKGNQDISVEKQLRRSARYEHILGFESYRCGYTTTDLTYDSLIKNPRPSSSVIKHENYSSQYMYYTCRFPCRFPKGSKKVLGFLVKALQ